MQNMPFQHMVLLFKIFNYRHSNCKYLFLCSVRLNKLTCLLFVKISNMVAVPVSLMRNKNLCLDLDGGLPKVSSEVG